MKVTFINRDKQNSSLILIMAGWSTDQRLFSHIKKEGWDVAVVDDYSSFDLDTSFLNPYSTIYLYAWSLGVFASSSLPAERITASFAINGTPFPVDDSYGIPVEIFNSTESTLTERNLLKFRMRMFGGRDNFNAVKDNLPLSDDIENLRQQLRTVSEAAQTHYATPIKWNRVFIASGDRIFPPENQQRAWKKILQEQDIVTLDAPHYLDLAQLIEMTIPEKREVALHFTRALHSYNSNASAQKIMAERLSSLINSRRVSSSAKILEIGPGAGTLTTRYAPLLPSAEVTFVDIADIKPFGLFPQEEYIKADAEQFLRDAAAEGRKWDFILSSATMQWFANQKEFIRNASASLSEGGAFIASTFIKGNLRELDAIRPSPLHYPSETDIREWMAESFSQVMATTETIRLKFDCFRDLLAHLRNTGVNAPSWGKAQGNIFSHRTITELTYLPIYLVGMNDKY